MDNNNQWNHESSNFAAMDSNDYEKAFESYISDVDDEDEGKVKRLYFLSSTISYFFFHYSLKMIFFLDFKCGNQ